MVGQFPKGHGDPASFLLCRKQDMTLLWTNEVWLDAERAGDGANTTPPVPPNPQITCPSARVPSQSA